MTVGEKIRNAREDMDISQSEISRLIPMNQSNYSKIERDLQEPSLEQLEKICRILKLDPRYLLNVEGFEFVSPEDMALLRSVKELIQKHSITKVKTVTAGDDNRQESAFKAFLRVSPDVKFVAIHDAARCLVTPEQITQVAVEAFSCGAAIAACKAKDTVKLVDVRKIKETPDRETVWQAQTPQIIKADMYRACIYTAMEDGFAGTDDASLCERHGFEVRVVDTGYENIKITTPIDLVIAEAIIKKRESEETAK